MPRRTDPPGTGRRDRGAHDTSPGSPYVVGDPGIAGDARLDALTAALLAARRDYTTTTTRAFGDRPSDLHRARQRYAHAALRYCAALQACGLALPHGLPETARWLLAGGEGRT
jgi:hypothetical protein